VVRLEVEEGAFHVWQAMTDLPESIDALTRIGAFVREHVRDQDLAGSQPARA
jgi:hypothetical protein